MGTYLANFTRPYIIENHCISEVNQGLSAVTKDHSFSSTHYVVSAIITESINSGIQIS